MTTESIRAAIAKLPPIPMSTPTITVTSPALLEAVATTADIAVKAPLPPVPVVPGNPAILTLVPTVKAQTPSDVADGVQPLTSDSSTLPTKPSIIPLRRYSILGQGLEVARRAQDQTPLLGSVCLAGEATIWFAEPNTGKTLMALRLLIDAILAKRIDPNNVYYVDVDDSSSGLATKLNILEEFGVHVLAEGYNGFRAENLVVEIERMIALDLAKGQFIILDTLKKFVSVIDKKASSQFTNLLRRFVLKGGSVLCLAHTNKRRGADGKPIYGGTSDFVDDFDCSYIISAVVPEVDSTDRSIMFENNKRRGDVCQRAYYTYSNEDGLSYEGRLVSVRIADPDRFENNDTDAASSDNDIIEAVKSSLQHGVATKMKLVKGVAKLSRTSERAVLGVIERHTGDDSARHLWTYDVQARGAKVFKLLPSAVPVETEVSVSTG